MFLGYTRYRLRSEWLRLLLGMVFAVILFSWFASINIIDDKLRSFDGYLANYQTVSRYEARSQGRAEPETAARSDLRPEYERFLRGNKGFLYAVLVRSVNDFVSFVASGLAVLLLTGLFANRRLEAPLAAGYSRGRVFLSLTGVYFGCIVLVWVISSAYLLDRYCIEFAPEEREFFRTVQLTWFCAFLWHASIAYLAAMLLRRSLPAFGAAQVIWLILSITTRAEPNTLPSYVIDNSGDVKPLLPGIDLQPLLRTDLVAVSFFLLAVLVAWLAFRKREQI